MLLWKTGFTLIELLVVISIIALLSIVAFINLKGFSQDQVLNKAVSEIQTLLRLAQANATAGVLCNSQGGANWTVNFKANKVDIELDCGDSSSFVKTLTLENVQVDSIKGASCGPPTDLPLIVTYSKISGNVKFDSIVGSDIDLCLETSANVLIDLKNLKTSNIKSFTISKGGAMDVR